MDILSIRKKAKQAASTTPPTSSSTPPTSTVTAAPMPAPTIIEPAPAFAVAEAPAPRPTSTTAPTMAAPTMAASTSTTATVTRPKPTDPLAGFLASHDAEGDEIAVPVRVSEEGSSDSARRFLSFRLVDEDYAASIMDVREILTIRSLTEVPRAPREVLGVVSKRGVVLPVIDLATSLGLRAPERRLRASQRVLVVGDGDRVCGLRVDAVAEVIRLQTGQIEEVPASLGQKNAGLLLGLGRTANAMYILLDVAAVLDAFALAMGIAPAPRAEG
jgi:purine-binding chemotaxis protein CheW